MEPFTIQQRLLLSYASGFSQIKIFIQKCMGIALMLSNTRTYVQHKTLYISKHISIKIFDILPFSVERVLQSASHASLLSTSNPILHHKPPQIGRKASDNRAVEESSAFLARYPPWTKVLDDKH